VHGSCAVALPFVAFAHTWPRIALFGDYLRSRQWPGPRGVALIRGVGTLLLVGWVLFRTDWSEFARTVAAANPVYLALSLALAPVLPWINAWKWQRLLRARQISVRQADCFRLYLIGYFYSNFLPTSVGGDVVRMAIVGQRTRRPDDAAASVFVERFSGLSVLALLAILVAPFGARELYPATVRSGLVLLGAGYLVLLWAVLDPRAERLSTRWKHRWGIGILARTHASIGRYRGQPRELTVSLLLSFAFYAGAILNTYLSARAFRAELSLTQAALATPLILAITLLPASIGGLGLLEWACVFALGGYGVLPAAGLAAALLMRFKNLLLGILGALSDSLVSPGGKLQHARSARERLSWKVGHTEIDIGAANGQAGVLAATAHTTEESQVSPP